MVRWLSRAFRSPRRVLAVAFLIGLIGLAGALAGTYLRAEYHFRAANKALAAYRLREAREHLAVCLKAWPRSGLTHLLAGRVARQLGESETAEEHLALAQRYLNQAEEVHLELLLLRVQAGQVDDDSVDRLRRLVAGKHPATPLILGAVANGYMRTFRLGDAQAVLQRWLEHEPDNPQALSYRGWVFEVSDVRSEAVKCYARVLEIDPDRDEARLRLAGLLLETTRLREAADHLELLRQRLPGERSVLTRLAECKMELGERDQARQILDRLLEESPDFGPALTARGSLAYREDRYEEALRWLRRAVSHDRGEYRARYLLYQALRRTGREEEARQEHGRMEQAKRDIGRLHEIVSKKMNLNPKDPALHCDMGMIFLRNREVGQGRRWLYSALALDPGYQPAHAALADHFEQAGDRRQAEAHRRRVRATAARPNEAPGRP